MHRSTMLAMNFIFRSVQVQTAREERKRRGMGKKREREREKETMVITSVHYWRGVERRKRKEDPFAGAARF